MSNSRQGPPKHQNRFAWKPNAGHKINETELGGRLRPFSDITGVCPRCREQIDWKRRYGKYKPLSHPAKCRRCSKRNVRQAYHNLCFGCAKEHKVCAKCCSRVDHTVGRDSSEVEAEKKMLEEAIKHARERDKRTLLRTINKSKSSAKTKNDKETVGELFPNASLEEYAKSSRNDGSHHLKIQDHDNVDDDHDTDNDNVVDDNEDDDGDDEDVDKDHDPDDNHVGYEC